MNRDAQYRANVVTALRWAAEKFDIERPLHILEVGLIPPPYRASYGASSRGSVFQRCLEDRSQAIECYNIADIDEAAAPDFVWDVMQEWSRSERYDVAVASETIEHCLDPIAALRGLRSCLRPEGLVVVTVPFLFREHNPKPDLWRFTPEGLRVALSRAGFCVLDMRSYNVGDVVANVGAIACVGDRASEE